MRMASATGHAQSGSISAALLGLAGLAGFAAGAMLVGVLALDVNTTPAAAGSGGVEQANAVPASHERWTPEPSLIGP